MTQKIMSEAGTCYFVNPHFDEPETVTQWKALSKSASIEFKAGDTLIVSPGRHLGSLTVQGKGSPEKPIIVRFLPGVHVFDAQGAVSLPLFISNASDAPHSPKPIGIFLHRARHVRLEGGGVSGPTKTTLLYSGRMIQVLNDESEDVCYGDLVFDLERPTVVEFKVLERSEHQVTLAVAQGSEYELADGALSWRNDLGFGEGLCQELEISTGRCRRIPGPPPWEGAQATELSANIVRLSFAETPEALKADFQYHYRRILRDVVGVFNNRCKDLTFHDCEFNAFPGLGLVSQFTENIFIRNVDVLPPPGTGRTCPAWGDAFHFSGCRGEIVVDSCRVSGMQDDALNCHGTFLRIVEQRADRGFLLRFMQPQTFGFAAFVTGDQVAVINGQTLREYEGNPRRHVVNVTRVNDLDWLIELDGVCPTFQSGDVIDNVSWHPNLTATNNHISVDPVRGFLVTTRGKVIISDNTFYRCHMAGMLVESDAGEWFESGPVRDMLISGNRFIDCGIKIYPRTQSENPDEPVHENIRIEGNYFENSGVWARNVAGLSVVGNSTASGEFSVDLGKSCSSVNVEGTEFDYE